MVAASPLCVMTTHDSSYRVQCESQHKNCGPVVMSGCESIFLSVKFTEIDDGFACRSVQNEAEGKQ